MRLLIVFNQTLHELMGVFTVLINFLSKYESFGKYTVPANGDIEQRDSERQDPVDKDEELRVLELALVARGVGVRPRHNLLLEDTPREVRALQAEEAEHQGDALHHLRLLGLLRLLLLLGLERDGVV